MGPFSDPRTPPRETLAVKNVWAQIGRFHERHRDKGTVVRLYRLCQPFLGASTANSERRRHGKCPLLRPNRSMFRPRSRSPWIGTIPAPRLPRSPSQRRSPERCRKGLVVTVEKVPPSRFVIAVSADIVTLTRSPPRSPLPQREQGEEPQHILIQPPAPCRFPHVLDGLLRVLRVHLRGSSDDRHHP